MSDRQFGFRTRALHAGGTPDAIHGARAVPIYQSTSFVFTDTLKATFNGLFGDTYRHVDVSDAGSVDAAFAAAVEEMGRLDVLAHPAAIQRGGLAEDVTPEDWDLMFAVNVRGTMLGAFVIGFLTNGLVIVGVSPFWQTVITGAVIILAVATDQIQQIVQRRRSHARAVAQAQKDSARRGSLESKETS